MHASNELHQVVYGENNPLKAAADTAEANMASMREELRVARNTINEFSTEERKFLEGKAVLLETSEGRLIRVSCLLLLYFFL